LREAARNDNSEWGIDGVLVIILKDLINVSILSDEYIDQITKNRHTTI